MMAAPVPLSPGKLLRPISCKLANKYLSTSTAASPTTSTLRSTATDVSRQVLPYELQPTAGRAAQGYRNAAYYVNWLVLTNG
jgi:hypothetical protein